jgi:hypothetical protein
MSFSSQTKNNLSRIIPETECCLHTELLALLRSDGLVKKNLSEEYLLEFETENAAVARKIFKLLRAIYDIPVEVSVRQKKRLKKNNKYTIRIRGRANLDLVLHELELSYQERLEDDYLENMFKGDCCYRAYLRGSFLGAGSVSNPEGDYHLELTSHNASNAYFILKAMERFGLEAKINKRKGRFVVYHKGSEDIVTFLNVIGAHKKLLEFENIRIIKDLRNRVNRGVNCETANLTKVVNTGVRQLEAIHTIDRAIGIEKLKPTLREAARIRLEFPSSSLKELGEMFEPPISKSAVNHRLRKIEDIADKMN